jgi:hypothetical protein
LKPGGFKLWVSPTLEDSATHSVKMPRASVLSTLAMITPLHTCGSPISTACAAKPSTLGVAVQVGI